MWNVFAAMRKRKPLARFDAAVDMYMDSVTASSPSSITIQAYGMHIRLFREFWTSNGTVMPRRDPSIDDAKAWRDALLASGKTKNTAHQYMASLHRMFDFVSDEELPEKERLYQYNPFPNRIMPSDKKKESRPYEIPLTDEQIAMLLVNVCPDKHARNSWPRNYAIIILLLTTALRNSELRALTPADLDFEHSEIVVEHGKGDKFRAVDFPPMAQGAVKLYMASKIRSDKLSDAEPLFGTYMPSKAAEIGNELGWRNLSRSGLSGIVEEHIRLVTGVTGVRSHAMRHICARVDLNGGMRLEELQAKLGHSAIQTTQIYSGRLMARRQRMSVEALLAARDEQAQENEKLLAKVQAKGRKYHAIVAS